MSEVEVNKKSPSSSAISQTFASFVASKSVKGKLKPQSTSLFSSVSPVDTGKSNLPISISPQLLESACGLV